MFKNRQDAGRQLAEKLSQELDFKNGSYIVLSIPRGGVILGHEIANLFNPPSRNFASKDFSSDEAYSKTNIQPLDCRSFNLPHDVIVTRKISCPNNSRLSVGAVGQTQGSLYVNTKLVNELGISQNYLGQEIAKIQQEIATSEKLYRGGNREIILKDKNVIIVGSGAATGITAISAAREVWTRSPKRVVVALPVCSLEVFKILETEADQVFVLEKPVDFFTISQFYETYDQITDEQVIKLLE